MADSLASGPTPVSQTVADTSSISATSAASADAVTKKRFLGRTVTVRELLGDGTVADLLLWVDWKRSVSFLAGVAVLWVLFELSGFSVVTIVADACMILITVVFIWAQICHLTKRDLPKIPELKLSAESVMEFAEAFCNEVNAFLHTAQTIALGSDYILFVKIMAALYLVSLLGSWFNGLTLTFITFILAFTVPFYYNKYEDQVDDYLDKGVSKVQVLYKEAESKVKDTVGKVQGKIQEKLKQKKQQ